MKGAYYNERDPFAAQWLRNLVADGLVCPGDVDDRDIRDVLPSELDGYAQCHFFAGIGIWSLALRMAGWADDRPVWTGSCPCQPFSEAGNGLGFADERHLWPFWHWLIQQRQPGVVFGEQVAKRAGAAWFDLVSTDMEGLGYACGAVNQPSAGYGAPNIRERLFWVADARCGADERWLQPGETPGAAGAIESQAREWKRRGADARSSSADGWLGYAGYAGLPDTEPPNPARARRWSEGRAAAEPSGAPDPWRELEWLDCLDGRKRPTQPGLFPLAPRYPGGVGRLRAYGNAINPWPAAEVIGAYLDCRP